MTGKPRPPGRGRSRVSLYVTEHASEQNAPQDVSTAHVPQYGLSHLRHVESAETSGCAAQVFPIGLTGAGGQGGAGLEARGSEAGSAGGGCGAGSAGGGSGAGSGGAGAGGACAVPARGFHSSSLAVSTQPWTSSNTWAHVEEQNISPRASRAHMRQTGFSQALQAATAGESGWLVQLAIACPLFRPAGFSRSAFHEFYRLDAAKGRPLPAPPRAGTCDYGRRA